MARRVDQRGMGAERQGMAHPFASTFTRSWPGPRQTLPTMTRRGSQGYLARLSSKMNTVGEGDATPKFAAGDRSCAESGGRPDVDANGADRWRRLVSPTDA